MESLTETVVHYPAPQGLADADTLMDLARAYGVIEDADLYRAAGTDLVACRKLADRLTEQRMKITRPMDEAKKAVMALFKPKLELIESAERLIKAGMRGYESAERARAEAAAKLIEDKRRAEEAKAQQEMIEARQLEEEAAMLAEAGDATAAAVIQQQAEVKKEEAIHSAIASTEIVAPTAAIPKIAGIARRLYYRPVIEDKRAFVAHVATHPELLDFLEINTKAGGPLQKMVDAMKLNLTLPGIKVIETDDPGSLKGE